MAKKSVWQQKKDDEFVENIGNAVIKGVAATTKVIKKVLFNNTGKKITKDTKH